MGVYRVFRGGYSVFRGVYRVFRGFIECLEVNDGHLSGKKIIKNEPFFMFCRVVIGVRGGFRVGLPSKHPITTSKHPITTSKHNNIGLKCHRELPICDVVVRDVPDKKKRWLKVVIGCLEVVIGCLEVVMVFLGVV